MLDLKLKNKLQTILSRVFKTFVNKSREIMFINLLEAATNIELRMW